MLRLALKVLNGRRSSNMAAAMFVPRDQSSSFDSVDRMVQCLLVLDQAALNLVLAQAAAVQERFPAAVAFLRFPAVEPYVRLQGRLFTVTGPA